MCDHDLIAQKVIFLEDYEISANLYTKGGVFRPQTAEQKVFLSSTNASPVLYIERVKKRTVFARSKK